MKMLIVGGTFNATGGKESYFIKEIQKHFNCNAINGGTLETLYSFRPKNIDVLLWMANVDNKEDKILPRLKAMNQKMLLISSKRVIEKKYSDYELVTRAINNKANLCLVIDKTEEYVFSIIDPLGNIFCDKQNLTLTLQILNKRLNELLKVKRMPSQQVEFDAWPNSKPISKKFVTVVKHFGKVFSKVIQANNPKRFLGNASTRCEWGFPSQRNHTHILVSKRNVNKEAITESNFVKAHLAVDKILYVGNKKPSVDTPVQLELYDKFKNINFMLHGHCYIENAPFTKHKIPCGDLNEVKEIINTASNLNLDFYVINLIGHGCIIMSKDIESFYKVKLLPRPLLEN